MICLPTAQLRYTENQTPVCCSYDDFYYSTTDGFSESEHVFINGNQITQRWRKSETLTIAEIGFGTGRNFLLTAECWLQRKTLGKLFYFSIENQPIARSDLAHLLESYPVNESIKHTLLRHYPPSIRGFHTISFHQQSIQLVLLFDEALSAIQQLDLHADAWYLDGFSPRCNADAWSNEVITEVHRCTSIGGTLATYCAASAVRKALINTGFEVQRLPGYGPKREMLTAQKLQPKKPPQPQASHSRFQWQPPSHKQTERPTATIIGAGLAGCCLAYALSRRNWQVEIHEAASALASGASGNRAAVLMPRMNLDHNPASRLTCSGYWYTLQWLHQLTELGFIFDWLRCGAIQLGRDEQQIERMHRIEQAETFSSDWLQIVTAQQASQLCGHEVSSGGWYFPQAGCLDPAALCAAIIQAAEDRVKIHFNSPVRETELENYSDHVTILACGYHVNAFTQTQHLPILKKRGQVSYFQTNTVQAPLQCIINANGYITPAINQLHTVGASFVSQDSATDLRASEHKQNLNKLQQMLPQFHLPSVEQLQGRAAIRAVSPDRLPLVGPVSEPSVFREMVTPLALGDQRSSIDSSHYHPDLYVFSGFSSRGLTWIPLCAEYLATKLSGEPSPLEASIAQSLHPDRFLFKTLKKELNQTDS